MKFTMTVDMNNAAFIDNPDELATLIRQVGNRVERGDEDGGIKDTNGNTVGSFVFYIDEADEDADAAIQQRFEDGSDTPSPLGSPPQI